MSPVPEILKKDLPPPAVIAADTRKPWTRSEVTELDMAETAAQPGVGNDGSQLADCTHF